MIVPINYFDPSNGQAMNLEQRAAELFKANAQVEIPELHKTYSSSQEQLLMSEVTSWYEGKKILFLGYIDKENSDFMIISRQMIKCCQADKEKIQIKAKGIESNLKEYQWIKIYGKICFDSDFYILVEEYKLQDEPNDVYFHQHL